MDVSNVAPATVQPTGPANARNALPPAMPVPPAARAPPPSHASAALVAAAPDKVEIAAPVDAVPNVVATHIAAEGARLATAIPAVTPEAALAAELRAACNSFSAYSLASENSALAIRISSKSCSNDFGVLAIELTSLVT